MSGGITATAVMAGAAVVGTGAAIMQGKEAEEQADKQYAAQQAAFANDIEAALTNNRWQKADNDAMYGIDQKAKDSQYSSLVDTIYATTQNQLNAAKGNAAVSEFKEIWGTGIQSEAALKELRTRSKAIAKDAEISLQYEIAMAEGRQDYNTNKALLESIEYANMANATVQLLDQDINIVNKELNRISEISDITAVEGLGKAILINQAAGIAGNTASRRAMSALIKSDMIKQQKVAEKESIIDKAYATQFKTAQETSARIQSSLNTAIAQNVLIQEDLVAGARKTIDSTKNSLEELTSKTQTTLETLDATLDMNLQAIAKSLNVDTEYLSNKAITDLESVQNEYDIDKIKASETYQYSKLQSDRNYEQSLMTKITSDSVPAADKEAAILEYDKFLSSADGKALTKYRQENPGTMDVDNTDALNVIKKSTIAPDTLFTNLGFEERPKTATEEYQEMASITNIYN